MKPSGFSRSGVVDAANASEALAIAKTDGPSQVALLNLDLRDRNGLEITP